LACRLLLLFSRPYGPFASPSFRNSLLRASKKLLGISALKLLCRLAIQISKNDFLPCLDFLLYPSYFFLSRVRHFFFSIFLLLYTASTSLLFTLLEPLILFSFPSSFLSRGALSTSSCLLRQLFFYLAYPASTTAKETAKNNQPRQGVGAVEKKSGSDLLSHTVARAVPSALEGLTTVFGMGTGVAPPT
jgi:hypothetical protein